MHPLAAFRLAAISDKSLRARLNFPDPVLKADGFGPYSLSQLERVRSAQRARPRAGGAKFVSLQYHVSLLAGDLT